MLDVYRERWMLDVAQRKVDVRCGTEEGGC